eukprot:1182640-Prorocentrum_minimum.AAC.1
MVIKNAIKAPRPSTCVALEMCESYGILSRAGPRTSNEEVSATHRVYPVYVKAWMTNHRARFRDVATPRMHAWYLRNGTNGACAWWVTTLRAPSPDTSEPSYRAPCVPQATEVRFGDAAHQRGGLAALRPGHVLQVSWRELSWCELSWRELLIIRAIVDAHPWI